MERLVLSKTTSKIVVLISGSGSNLQSIIDKQSEIGVEISCVISNKNDVLGLERAKKAGIKTEVVISKGKQRAEFDAELAKVINKYNPKLVILAGFMRILTEEFTDMFKGKMLNIHPSLLPKFKGLNTHKRAIEAGEIFAGASVHLVSSELDSGEIIKQTKVAIDKNETQDTLAKKVLIQEHILYPQAIKEYLSKIK
jgi:phosphoribosylglycinamide formyltransferase-1